MVPSQTLHDAPRKPHGVFPADFGDFGVELHWRQRPQRQGDVTGRSWECCRFFWLECLYLAFSIMFHVFSRHSPSLSMVFPSFSINVHHFPWFFLGFPHGSLPRRRFIPATETPPRAVTPAPSGFPTAAWRQAEPKGRLRNSCCS